jgi:hypothetical protein
MFNCWIDLFLCLLLSDHLRSQRPINAVHYSRNSEGTFVETSFMLETHHFIKRLRRIIAKRYRTPFFDLPFQCDLWNRLDPSFREFNRTISLLLRKKKNNRRIFLFALLSWKKVHVRYCESTPNFQCNAVCEKWCMDWISFETLRRI